MEKLIAIDINVEKAESEGIAYYRLDPQFKKFLAKCEKKHGILGFEYDGSFNFGVILKKNNGENKG